MNNRGIFNDILLLVILASAIVAFADLRSEIRKPRMNSQIARFLDKLPNCKVVVTSTFRTPAHNRKVGGAKRSMHLYNRAVDLVVDPECRKMIIKKARLSGLTVIIYPKGHLHLDNRKKVQCLIKLRKGYKFCKSSGS